MRIVHLALDIFDKESYYINLDRISNIFVDEDGWSNICFPIDQEDKDNDPDYADCMEGAANIMFPVDFDMFEYLNSLPEVNYVRHPEGDWKNWCEIEADDSFGMYW